MTKLSLDSCRHNAISYWESAVVAAARAMDCSQIYTENLNSGQEYEGIRAINPFA